MKLGLACVECGADWQELERMVKTQWGPVCTPCYGSGDTGEPFYAICTGKKECTDEKG